MCPLSTALDFVGDRWTILILRELLGGSARFQELRDGLPGIASNLLTERLRRLESDGIIRRVRAHSGRDPGAKEEPAIYYYTWDKDNLKFTRHLIAKGVGTGLFIRTADLDGNGKLDIAVSGKSGTYLLFQK